MEVYVVLSLFYAVARQLWPLRHFPSERFYVVAQCTCTDLRSWPWTSTFPKEKAPQDLDLQGKGMNTSNGSGSVTITIGIHCDAPPKLENRHPPHFQASGMSATMYTIDPMQWIQSDTWRCRSVYSELKMEKCQHDTMSIKVLDSHTDPAFQRDEGGCWGY